MRAANRAGRMGLVTRRELVSRRSRGLEVADVAAALADPAMSLTGDCKINNLAPGGRGGFMDTPRVHATADVHDRAVLGEGTTIWHLAQIREDARLGKACIVGRGAYVGPGVIIGDNVKLQNYALVYEPALLESNVFVGPAAVLTNDVYPRSVDVTGKLKRSDDWEPKGVIVREGASLGAHAVVVAGCEIGNWALVAAGAVVTRDVADFALVAGGPARRIGWVGRAGKRLLQAGRGRWACPETAEIYLENDGVLVLGS
jgi:UDP-2-acetamido-3-amino-2,3-dideoxy-glucuronate N-acetyltransferase